MCVIKWKKTEIKKIKKRRLNKVIVVRMLPMDRLIFVDLPCFILSLKPKPHYNPIKTSWFLFFTLCSKYPDKRMIWVDVDLIFRMSERTLKFDHHCFKVCVGLVEFWHVLSNNLLTPCHCFHPCYVLVLG